MMNKMRSAKVHLIKFLFVLPLMTVLLLAFRGGRNDFQPLNEVDRAEFLKKNPDVKSVGWVYDNIFSNNVVQIILNKKIGHNEVYYVNDKSSTTKLEKKYGINYSVLMPDLVLEERTFLNLDTIPDIKKVNTKGYFIDIKDNKGNCIVVIKDKDEKEIKKLLLTDWNKKEKYYEDLYGEIAPAPASCDVSPAKTMPDQPAQPVQTAQPSQPVQPNQPAQPAQPLQPASPKSPIKLRSITFTDESSKPLVIVDGVEWPASLDMNVIDAEKIESMSVLKDVSTINKYGDKGKNGVLIITTKKQAVKSTQPVRVRVQGATANPIYYLNGKQTTKEAVELIEPTLIKSVDVLKGSKAEEKYGEKGKNGVIEIQAIIPTEVNYIEKKKIPEWDFKNFLPGKKKDEC